MHDGLGDEARALEVGLDVRRREVLAARGDDDVLLAAGDGEEAVGVERAQVAGVQPAVVRRAAVIAGEHVQAADDDLAVGGDAHLDAGQRAADRPERGGASSVAIAMPVAASVIP